MTGDGTYTYVYDYEKRLIRVTEEANVVTSFVYDALGRRVKKTDSDGNITTYFYSGQHVIEEYEGADILKREYVYGPGIDNGNASRCLDEAPLRRVSRHGGDYHDGANTYPYYYHKDGLGSVTELTDVDGALVQAYEYDAWGVPTIYDTDDPELDQPYLYTGRRWDGEIGLYYYRARHYNPQIEWATKLKMKTDGLHICALEGDKPAVRWGGRRQGRGEQRLASEVDGSGRSR